MQRYKQIEVILKYEKPEVIMEIGTWNGDRAIRMCQAAGTNKYLGFDLFEDANESTDKVEMNVKSHFTQDEVYKKLDKAGIDAILIKGNTRKTLPEFLESFGNDQADFAFIDGGHSVSTIQSDYDVVKELVRPGKLIIFDDFYSNMEASFDFDKYGANKVVENLKDWKLLPSDDPVKGGGVTHLVVVRNEK
jgi:predicted O-methyltransferase YrrM